MKLSNTQKDFLRFIGIKFSYLVINLLLKSVRVKIRNHNYIKELIDNQKNFVVAFWHGSMAIGWYLHKNKNCSALVSKSKDGDVLAHLLSRWNYKVLRGSSHIGGKDALESMVDLLKNGYSIAITPDGPTGPYYKMKAGAVVAAKKSNVPLFMVGINCSRKITLKSWDKFEVPLPFSKVTAVYSEPVIIYDGLSYDETSNIILECESLLKKLQKDAAEVN